MIEINFNPVSKANIVSCARSWVGTKFRHQASVKGQGSDCAGLVRGVLLECGSLPDNYKKLLPTDFLAYPKSPDGSMRSICDQIFEKVDSPEPGDVGLFKWFKYPQHLSFFGDYVHGGLSMIQALGPNSPNAVLENRFDETWRKRMVCCYRIPGSF